MCYNKKDAQMTQGYAILSMLILHLFCKIGNDVDYTPLFYVKAVPLIRGAAKVPLAYYFGYFSNICVCTYSLCAGYARELSHGKDSRSYSSNLKKIFQLAKRAWIIIILFSLVDYFFGKVHDVPMDGLSMIKYVLFIDRFNGAWWYLQTYFILLLIPYDVLMYPINHLKHESAYILCFAIISLFFVYSKIVGSNWAPRSSVIGFFYTQIYKFIDVLPEYWIGALFCRADAVSQVDKKLRQSRFDRHRSAFLLSVFLITFFVYNLIHISCFTIIVASITFFCFNLWEKSTFVQSIFMFLGKHSTNIWLTHMFFYLHMFPGLAQKAKYPILVLLALLGYSLFASFIIDFLEMMLNTTLKKLHIKE